MTRCVLPFSSGRGPRASRVPIRIGDLAVYLDPELTSQQRWDIRLKLMADLDELGPVDVVILNDAPPLLAHRILSQGTLVFERSAVARVRFQVRTAARYLDFVPVYETYIRYLKKHVREGRVRG